MKYVSRAGEKLEAAISVFSLGLVGLVCADFGSSAGGFVDCLLQHGALKVYAVETGYGLLDWKLRTNENVIVMEKTNAMHVILPEKVDFISIDTSWTRLENIMRSALDNLKDNGSIVALVKPHYEADRRMLVKGRLKDEFIDDVLEKVKAKLEALGVEIINQTPSPILGEKGKNKEFLFYLKRLG